jgi:hypothetical protein
MRLDREGHRAVRSQHAGNVLSARSLPAELEDHHLVWSNERLITST